MCYFFNQRLYAGIVIAPGKGETDEFQPALRVIAETAPFAHAPAYPEGQKIMNQHHEEDVAYAFEEGIYVAHE